MVYDLGLLMVYTKREVYASEWKRILRVIGSKALKGNLTGVASLLRLFGVSIEFKSTSKAILFKKFTAGLACQRPPPVSNQDRCPPRLVVQRTV